MANHSEVRPLVPTAIRTEFGDVLESEAFTSPTVGRDLTYVPGYSDLRRARDAALKEVAEGTRKVASVPTLPVRLQWVRTAKVSGAPDSVKEVQYGVDGYRKVTKEDIGTDWLKAIPAGATVTAGAEIRQGDCVLMVADAKTAAKRSYEHRVSVDRLSKNPASELMRVSASKPGTDATYEALPGREIAAPPSAIKR